MEKYLPLLLLLMFHFNSHLTSSANLDSPFSCNPHQSHALLQFKSTFTVDTAPSSWRCDSPYPKTESWKEDTDCCSSWDGVTCDEVTGHLVGLDLSCSQLVGTIHPNSTLFSSHIALSLTHLNLSNSRMSGNIPSEISLLSHLVSLDLSYSDFNGNIPFEISHLSNLVSLDLSANFGLRVQSDRVLESIARNLTRLRSLHLDIVNMSSLVQASSSLMNLSSSLASLSLDGCQLQGRFPISFFILPCLQELSLAGNNFDPVNFNSITPPDNLTFLALSYTDLPSVSIGFLDFVGNLRSLRTLFLVDCGLTGSFLPPFSNLAKLNKLDLSFNNFNCPIPGSLCNLTQLLDLDLGDSRLNGMLPSCLFAMPSLETLRLNDNKLYGQIPTSLFKSANLNVLDLSSNNLSGSFGLHKLLDLKKLRYLSLSHNNLSASTSTRYNLSYSLPRLEVLDLSSCNLAEFPYFLKALPNLKSLDISNNNIQGPIPEWMFVVGNTDFSRKSLENARMLPWKNIEFLDFHSSLLQGHLPNPSLTTKFFSVSNNSFIGEIAYFICNLASVEVLDLSHNRFVGLIPQCLGNLSKLSVLNLGTNNLHGTIPDMFAKDNRLNYLNFNKNQFRGSLPPSLSYCQFSTILDVGHNFIEDTFPYWLEILSLLQVLVLRSNNFFGSTNGFKSNSCFPSLRILDVQNNNLTGQLPTRLIGNLKTMMNVQQGLGSRPRYMVASNVSFGINYYSMTLTVKGIEMKYEKILTAMATIDFSRNKFEGDIPEVIGKLGSLK